MKQAIAPKDNPAYCKGGGVEGVVVDFKLKSTSLNISCSTYCRFCRYKEFTGCFWMFFPVFGIRSIMEGFARGTCRACL